ncbi:MAG TPA: amylo-alpha-1,6-glucosidase, partial [Candidatus Eisenbacteria bacterium]
MALAYPRTAEWLEADGLGGFASGTVEDLRTRRYHALLLHAATPPADRHVLVNGIEAWLERGEARTALSSQRYAGGVVVGGAASAIESFECEPWPRWTLALPGDVRVTHERFARHELPLVVLRWNVRGAPAGTRLAVRPLLSGRDPHALHHGNDAFRFDAERLGRAVGWRPYASVPGVLASADGDYEHAPDWYWRFSYTAEEARGLDSEEDLASPGIFRWDLARSQAVLLLGADVPGVRALFVEKSARELAQRYTAAERRRRATFASPLHRAADTYVVTRGKGRTIIAGYPWFGDWGRDTFIALRGLCLATGRLDAARDILLAWSAAVSEGMLPNRFPDPGTTPEYNSVDASLWFVVVAGEWLDDMAAAGRKVAARDAAVLRAAIEAILDGYARGTRYGIRGASDGLLAAGEPGVQLTWMDAKVGDRVVTPRIGKPVEVQALWVNALDVGARFARRFAERRDSARVAFVARFWNESRGCLYDVVDVDHVAGAADPALRPNQLFALGGLPLALVEGPRARRALAVVAREL